MATFLKSLLEDAQQSPELNTPEILERNHMRVDMEYVPESPMSTSIHEDTFSPIITTQRGSRDEERNIFDFLNEIKESVSELNRKLENQLEFKLEGQNKKDINMVAKRFFGTDIFNVGEDLKKECSEIISEEMGRPAKASEMRTVITHIRRKYATEYRPQMYRVLKSTMTKSRVYALRKCFRNFTDPMAGGYGSEYRNQLILIMRCIQRTDPARGEFWRKVQKVEREMKERSVNERVQIIEELKKRDERSEQ